MGERNRDREFFDTVGRKEQRKHRARQKRGGHSFWLGLSMFGLIGWSVVVPTLLLTALGMWLDTRYDSGISWTVTGLFTGVILGSLNAWFWIEREGHEDDENEENIG